MRVCVCVHTGVISLHMFVCVWLSKNLCKLPLRGGISSWDADSRIKLSRIPLCHTGASYHGNRVDGSSPSESVQEHGELLVDQPFSKTLCCFCESQRLYQRGHANISKHWSYKTQQRNKTRSQEFYFIFMCIYLSYSERSKNYFVNEWCQNQSLTPTYRLLVFEAREDKNIEHIFRDFRW